MDFIDVDLEWYLREQQQLAASSQIPTSTPNLDPPTSSTPVIDSQSGSLLSGPTADIPIHTPAPQMAIPIPETSPSVDEPAPEQQPSDIQPIPQDPSAPPESTQTSSVISNHISPVPTVSSPTNPFPTPTHPSLDSHVEDFSMAAPSNCMETDLDPVDTDTVAPLESASSQEISSLPPPAVQPRTPPLKPDATLISNDMEVEPAPDIVVPSGADRTLQENVHSTETTQPAIVSNDPPLVSGDSVDVTMDDDSHKVLSRHPSPSRSDAMDIDVAQGDLKQMSEPVDSSIPSVDASLERLNEPSSIGPSLPLAAVPSTNYPSVGIAKSLHDDTAPGGSLSSSTVCLCFHIVTPDRCLDIFTANVRGRRDRRRGNTFEC